jgi:hypothetical protein
MSIRHLAVALAAAVALLIPSATFAQGFGLGPRVSFVRGDLATGTESSRFLGGTIRMSSSRRVVIEVAMDFRTGESEDGASRLRERPIQGSLLLFPVRSTFAPYLLGGVGLYSRTADALDDAGTVLSSETTRETGAHFGFGAELFFGRHAALFADYRFRFVRFGSPEEGDEAIDIPLVDSLNVSHRGSMWTSGLVFYF